MHHIYKKEEVAIHRLDQLTLYLLLGVIAGARLGHILFYYPLYYLERPVEILPFRLEPEFHFTGLAGLASHGGVAGAVIALFLCCRKDHKGFLWISDRTVIAGALLGSFIRIGNLMNSEILGKGTDAGWAFVFTRADNIPRHPAQLYEAAGYLLTFIVLFAMWKSPKTKPPGFIFGSCLVLVFVQRFVIEFLKTDQVPFEASLPINMGQILSIPLIITGLIIIVISHRHARSGFH